MWNYKRQNRILAWSAVILLCLTIVGGFLMARFGPGLQNQAWVHTKLILLQEHTAALSWIEKIALALALGVTAGIGLPAFPFIVLLTPAFGPLKAFIGFTLMEMIIIITMKHMAKGAISRDTAQDAEIWDRVAEQPAITLEMAFFTRLHFRLPQRFVDYFLLSPGWKNPSEAWILFGTLAGQAIRVGLQVLWAWAAWNVWQGFQPFPEVDLILLVVVSVSVCCLFLWTFVPELVFGGGGLESFTRFLNGLPEPPPPVPPSELAPPPAVVEQPAEPIPANAKGTVPPTRA